MSKLPNFDPVLIPVAQLEEFPGNPNEQDSTTFNNLLDEIENDGWDEPVVVVPSGSKYAVVSGNHRLKAAKTLGYSKIPCIVKDWDEEESKIKLVRRNMLRGEQNPLKFTKLINSIDNHTEEELSELMGFKDFTDFVSLLVPNEDNDIKIAHQQTKEESLIEGLSLILNRLFSQYGDTIPHSFMYFLVGGKTHMVVQVNDKLKSLLDEISNKCVNDGLDINLILTGLLGLGMKSTHFVNGPPEREDIEKEANEPVVLDKDTNWVE